MTELLLRISAESKGLAPMVQSLAKAMFLAKLERDCVDCRLYAEAGNPRSLLYVERWTTPEAFEAQLRSPRFGTLLAIMESAPEAPELEVRTVSEQRGLDYVGGVRLGNGGAGASVDPGRTRSDTSSTEGSRQRLPGQPHSTHGSQKGGPS